MAAASVCVPRGHQLPPASPWSTSGFDADSLQITASVLGLALCETYCVPFKSLCFLDSSGSPMHKPCCLSKPHILEPCFPGAGPPGWEAWCRAQTPHSSGRTSAVVIILPFVGCLPGGCGSDHRVSLPSLTISLWLLLCIFSCGKSFLLVFRLFS